VLDSTPPNGNQFDTLLNELMSRLLYLTSFKRLNSSGRAVESWFGVSDGVLEDKFPKLSVPSLSAPDFTVSAAECKKRRFDVRPSTVHRIIE